MATDIAVERLIANGINFDAIISIDSMKKIECFNHKSCINKTVFSGIKTNSELLELNRGKNMDDCFKLYVCVV